ncbi:MAG: ribokinase [Chloroflexi bacterium]|nr:MAG: ribokinase [Chloroflexota bacterium]
MSIDTLNTLVTNLSKRRVLVIGDAVLDEYLIGKTTRLSREAPIPVLEFESRELIPGGATNPAANIVSLGSTAVQVGVVGADAQATSLRQILQGRGIEIGGLVTDSTRPTTVKTRIMAQMGLRFPQQVARIDTLSREPVGDSAARRIREIIRDEIPQADAVLLSDYHLGLLTPSLVKAVRQQARQAGILLTADAQGSLYKYQGFALVKCNADEARAFLQRDIRGDDAFANAARALCDNLKLTGGMVITRGADGATLATHDGDVVHCPAPSVTDVYDTVGAGDTAIAVITLAVIAGGTLADAVTLANYASGVVIRHVGNYTPTPDELSQALEAWR